MRARVLIVASVLVAAAAAAARADRVEPTVLRSSFSRFPMQLGAWMGSPQPPLTDEVLAVLGADDYLVRSYAAGGVPVGLFIGYWQSQRQGDTIHSPLNCLPGAGWEPVEQSIVQLPGLTSAQPTVPVNRVVIQKGLDRELVYYWYQAHGRMVASEYWGKFYLMADAVRLNRTDGALVRVIAPIVAAGLDVDTAGAEAAAERRAREFVAALRPELNGFLPE